MGSYLGLDPGTEKTGFDFQSDRLCPWGGECDNEGMLEIIADHMTAGDVVAIEKVSVGRVSGREIGETIWWAGRFYEAAVRTGAKVVQVHRNTVLAHFETKKLYKPNGDRMNNDAALRQRLIELLGKDKVPTSSHQRSALAVAIVARNQLEGQ